MENKDILSEIIKLPAETSNINDLIISLEAEYEQSEQLSVNKCISIYKKLESIITFLETSYNEKKDEFDLAFTIETTYELKSALFRYQELLKKSNLDLGDIKTKAIIGDTDKLIDELTKFIDRVTNGLDYSDLERSLASFSNSSNPSIKLLERKLIGVMAKQNSALKTRINEETKRVSELNAVISTLNEKVDAELEKASSYSLEKINEIESNVEYLKKASVAVAVDQVTQKHAKRATEEGEHATFLRAIALGCLGISAGIVLLSIFGVLDTFDWKDLAIKYGAILFFTIPFAYLAKESNKHRDAQRKYENFDLSYSAASSFIQSMSKDDRLKLQADLARQMLVNNNPEMINEKSRENTDSDHVITDLAQKIIEMMNKRS